MSLLPLGVADAPILRLSPGVVNDLALGKDDPADIAERYGVSLEDLNWLLSQDWFNRAVLEKRLELDNKGILDTELFRLMAMETLQRLFQQGITGQLTPPVMMDLASKLADLGGLKPDRSMVQGGGGGFQVNIQINQGDIDAPARVSHAATPPPPPPPRMEVTFDAVAKEAVQVAEGDAFLPPPPSKTFRVPDFGMAGDLVGTGANKTLVNDAATR
jgi:hypothetical protein